MVADSDVEEEETTSSVRMVDATEKAETPEEPAAAIVIEESPVTVVEETMNLNEFKSVNLSADTEMKDYSEVTTMRRDRNDEPECGNSEVIYTQHLIVRDLLSIGNVRSTGVEGVVDFKRFRKVRESLWILNKCYVRVMMSLFFCFVRGMLYQETASVV